MATLQHAKAELATPAAQFIPCGATIVAAPIEWLLCDADGLRGEALNGEHTACVWV